MGRFQAGQWLVVAVNAVLAGAETFVGIALWVRERRRLTQNRGNMRLVEQKQNPAPLFWRGT
jgi:hypothetical protein